MCSRSASAGASLRVGVRFVLTAALLGVAAMWLSILVVDALQPIADAVRAGRTNAARRCAGRSIALAVAKLAWEAAIFRHLLLRQMTPLKRSALLMTRDLSNVDARPLRAGPAGRRDHAAVAARRSCDARRASRTGAVRRRLTGLLFVACLAGELLERYLFFAACAAPRMPGGIR